MKSGVGAGSLDLRLDDDVPLNWPVATVALRADRGVEVSYNSILEKLD